MRKQVQKERCTKIMLTKCKAVCHLYDKVQLAAAKMLDAEPAIFQFECNVPILCNDIPANDLNTAIAFTIGNVLQFVYHQQANMIDPYNLVELADKDINAQSAR